MFSRFTTKKNIFIPKFEYIFGIYFYVHINKIYRFEKRNSKFNIVSSKTSSVAAPIRRRVILLYSYLQRFAKCLAIFCYIAETTQCKLYKF